MQQDQTEMLTRRVNELQGNIKGLEIALLLVLKRLSDYAQQPQPESLAKLCASLNLELHQSADFYAEHALATAIPDEQIERSKKVLTHLASVLKQ